MALASKDAVGTTLAPFFKPENYAADLALILEPRMVRENVPGAFGPKDQVTAHLTVFRNQASLDKGEPSSVGDVCINATILTRDLKRVYEDAAKDGDSRPAVIAVLGRYKPKGGGNESWVFRAPRDDDYDKAVAYYNKREEGLKAKIAAVPSFDD